MDKVRLGDVATYINGYAFKPEDWGEVGKPIIRIQDLTGSSYQTNRFDGDVPSKYIVVAGDVLISWSASLGVYVWSGEDAVLNQHIFKVVFDKVNVDKSFFIHQVGGILDKAASDTHGATMKHLTKPVFDNLPFYLPEIHEQRNISRLLDKTASLITERRQQLTALDTLIKARFVEMFGNPVLNDKGWKTNTVKEITTKIGSGATPKGGKESYREEGISLIRSMNVHNGYFEYRELAHISDEQADKLSSVIIEEEDVLLNITGASVARSCVVPDDVLPARVNQHVCIIRCKHDIVPQFMNCILTDENYQKLLWETAGSGATREAITKQQVEGLKIIMPPMDLQEQFAAFVTQIDKSKAVVQKGLDEAQMLFDSLMQQYFG